MRQSLGKVRLSLEKGGADAYSKGAKVLNRVSYFWIFLLHIYVILFNSEQWDQVEIDHNAKALKFSRTCPNTEPAFKKG